MNKTKERPRQVHPGPTVCINVILILKKRRQGKSVACSYFFLNKLLGGWPFSTVIQGPSLTKKEESSKKQTNLQYQNLY